MHIHAQPDSESTLTRWKGLLIDQSALTAVWREPLTLWLLRACVQWPCKGSLALTQGVSALPWRRWCAQTHTYTHKHTDAGGTCIPGQSPSGMHRHRAVSVFIQSGGGDTGGLFLLRQPYTAPACIPPARLLPRSGHKVSKFSAPTPVTLTNAWSSVTQPCYFTQCSVVSTGVLLLKIIDHRNLVVLISSSYSAS